MGILKKIAAVFFSFIMFFGTLMGKAPKIMAKESEPIEQVGETEDGIVTLKKNDVQHAISIKSIAGKKMIIPSNFSSEEIDLLERLVSAEAKGESLEGMIEVAMVVLNRLDDSRFPNTLREVVYEKNQFQPVDNGTINNRATEEAKIAVQEAIKLRGTGDKSIFFYNPSLVTSSWLETREVTKVIDNHLFAK